MSRLFLGTDPEMLAHHLGQALERQLREGDPFEPVTLIVPNPHLGKWLKMNLARQLGVAMNIRFSFVEQALWDLLRQVDTRNHPRRPEMLDGDLYRFLVLSVLLEHAGPELESLRYYLGRAEANSPARWRRAWQLADRLSGLIRDYEYHRLEPLILPWLEKREGQIQLSNHDRAMEKAQRTLFYEITREPGGRRVLLNDASGRNFKTLPQYAGEVMEMKPPAPETPQGRVYLFGISQLSGLHIQTLSFLAGFFDLQFYAISPLAPLLREREAGRMSEIIEDFRKGELGKGDLFRRWCRAGAESLWLMQALLKPKGPVEWEVLVEDTGLPLLEEAAGGKGKATARKKKPEKADLAPTVLSRLQESLLKGKETEPRVKPDFSLQIVGCPGVQREVETVYQSILHNLQTDPLLRLTDIAVLVTDMKTYRPALQGVFEREPGRLGYSLVDHSAAGVSLWGQAFLGMLDLAQENFARGLVFEVVLNPCVLDRLGVCRAEAQVWLHWAEELGAYHGWDPKERSERGHAASPLFAWKQALQRLRLGRYMEAEADPFQPGAIFGGLVPHADIHSGDRHQLDAFCRAIEGLLPLLIHLRTARENGRWWADKLRYLAQRFLAVPEDRPAEARVRDQLLAALEQLELWDQVHREEPERAKIPLALVRQFLNSGLEGISASRGDYLVAGVTVSALQPMRPVPFKVVYVLGLNETLFPRPNFLSSLDLRSHERMGGDVLPAEQNHFLLLEVLLATRSKLYLLYNNRELQKDRELLPAMPLLQLIRYLEEKVVQGPFKEVKMPLHGHDTKYLSPPLEQGYQDVLVQYGEFARGLALQDGLDQGILQLSFKQQKELEEWRKRRRENLTLPPSEKQKAEKRNVPIRHLREFLLNPGKAYLERHLRLEREEAEEETPVEEPFYSDYLRTQEILNQVMTEVIRRQVRGDLPPDIETWARWIDPVHEDHRLRCQAPSGPFGEVDRRHLKQEFLARVGGEEGLKSFLDQHPPETFCGPILLGESFAPVGARLHFPVLKVPGPASGGPGEARLVGHWDLAWWRPGQSFDLLLLSYVKKCPKSDALSRQVLEPLLFCLALLAQQGTDRAGQSARKMLEDTPWNIHLMTGEGLMKWTYQPGDIRPEEAVGYLQGLVADYLDYGAFDLLPLEVILAKGLQETVFGEGTDPPLSEEAFAQRLEEKVEGEREWEVKSWDSKLLRLLEAKVPKDALAKARRRLVLLDRGPARVRAEAIESKSASKAKGKGSSKSAGKPRDKRSKGTVD